MLEPKGEKTNSDNPVVGIDGSMCVVSENRDTNVYIPININIKIQNMNLELKGNHPRTK